MIFRRKNKRPLCKCGCGEYVTWSKYRKKWNTFLKGHGARNRIVSEETKKKMSEIAKKRGFFKEYNKTEEHRLKVIKSNKKRKLSEETKKKISNSLKGFKHSKETKLKMKNAYRKVGKESTNWKGGKCPYGERWHHKISPQIKKRDGKCVYCGSSESLQAHHIDFDKKNNDVFNLVTLCKSHHVRLHPRKEFFNKESLKRNNKIAQEIQKQIVKYIRKLKQKCCSS